MRRLPVPSSVDTELRNTFYSTMDNAAPLPIELDAAPTTAGGELKEGEIGIFGTNLYQTINGVTYSMPLTAV